MLRLFNILAVVLLIASAVYAYTIKYQTAYRYEQIAKTKIEIKAERDALAVLRAEWAYMTRPERLQHLADQYLSDLAPLKTSQIVVITGVPERATHGDAIAGKLDALGLGAGEAPTIDITGSIPKTASKPVVKPEHAPSTASTPKRQKP
jgi:cell division protein FtsL